MDAGCGRQASQSSPEGLPAQRFTGGQAGARQARRGPPCYPGPRSSVASQESTSSGGATEPL